MNCCLNGKKKRYDKI